MSTSSSAANSPINTDHNFEKGRPSGTRQRSLSIERKRNESKVNEHKLGITIDRHSLDFNLKGDLCPVHDRDDKTKFVTDTTVLTNTDPKKKYFFYVAVDPSLKWEVLVNPMKGELGPKKSQSFSISLRVFLSTKVKSFIDVFFSENKAAAKEAMQARLKGDNKKREGALPITMIVNLETTFSPKLDLDEVELKDKDPIGRGGNGEVWRATWRNSEYALKKFRAEEMIDEERQMIDREISLMRSFPPNKYVVSYAASTVLKEQPLAILMEYCPKGSLADLLKNKPNLDNRFRVKIAIDVARGMAWLHSNKIYHRDLKPGNLLIVNDQEDVPLDTVHVKITDFGTSRSYVSETLYFKSRSNLKQKQPEIGLLVGKIEDLSLSKGVGTLQYTAPEMLEGKEDYELEKLDIYSFGVVMWELFAQIIPYSQPADQPYTKSKWDLIDFVKGGNRLKIPPQTPPKIAELIEKCWAQDASKRPSFSVIEGNLKQEYDELHYEPKLTDDEKKKIGYRGNISREAASVLLLPVTVASGTFLTRWSPNQQSYVISYNKDGKEISHISGIKIIPTNHKIVVGQKEFDNIVDCVKQFIDQKKITVPLPITGGQDGDYEKAYHSLDGKK